ncbi:MAG: UDP-N-acetylmuramoyl-L-alanyl-D-glutamate--2,6-diaminopimelate ligase [Candidatus Babeliales bacterium]
MRSHFLVTAHTDYVGLQTIFIAIPGTKNHGHDYIPLALQKGASTIVIQHDQTITSDIYRAIDDAGAFLITVPNARQALAELSAQAYGYPAARLKIIGITGTKGKTTTTCALAHILASAGHATAMISTVHNKINETLYAASLTTPQPDYLHAFFEECVRQEVEYVVMEVSAQAVSMHRVDGISFDAVVFTNFSQEHAEFYNSQEDYFAAKVALLERVKPIGFSILNVDDQAVQSLLLNRENAYAISCAYEGADYYAKLMATDLSGTKFQLSYGSSVLEFETPLLGKFNVYNSLAAVAVAHNLKIDMFRVYNSLATIPAIPGRLERYQLPNGAQCIIDYAHTPSSYEALLTLLRGLSDHLIVVFGCGGDRDTTKRPAMGKIASELADRVILTSDNPRSEDPGMIMQEIAAGVAAKNTHKIMYEIDREKAIRRAYALSGATSIIALLGKGPDEYQIFGSSKSPFSEKKIIYAL